MRALKVSVSMIKLFLETEQDAGDAEKPTAKVHFRIMNELRFMEDMFLEHVMQCPREDSSDEYERDMDDVARMLDELHGQGWN
jgi:hypothetical protein